MEGSERMANTQLIDCPSCGAKNRVPLSKIAQGLQPSCGRCKQPLPLDSKPVTVTDGTFASVVEHSPLPVLLDMWAPWCGPCRMVAPVIEELAKEMAGRVRIGKLNVDENPATAARFGVQSIPTLLVLDRGREIDCRRAAEGRDRAAAGTGATHLSQRRHRTTRGDVQPIPSRRSVRRRGIKAIKRLECKTLRINADSRLNFTDIE
jgi:thioredoxin 2